MNKYNQGNILVIRFSSIGDIVITTPVLRALKQQLNANVTFLTKMKYREVLKDNPNIDQILTYEELEIEPDQFDLIIDLQKNPKSTLLASKFNAPKITYNKLNIRKWVLVNFKLDFMGDQHLVDRYFHALRKIGLIDDKLGLEYYVGDVELSEHHLPKKYCVVNCGGTYHTKRIPYAKVVQLVKSTMLHVVLLGGDDVFNEFIGIGQDAIVYNLIGKTTLEESASIINNSEKLYTSDSALMHIGAAFNINMTVFWGNTSPRFGMYPYGIASNRIDNKIPHGLKCHPCSKLGFDKCPKGHFKCMNQHKVQ